MPISTHGNAGRGRFRAMPMNTAIGADALMAV
jgi:hypothetical protein